MCLWLKEKKTDFVIRTVSFLQNVKKVKKMILMRYVKNATISNGYRRK